MRWTGQFQYNSLEAGICRHLHSVRIAHIIDTLGAVHSEQSPSFRLLDAGCGDGIITKRIRDSFPHAHIEAVDADPERLVRARSYCPEVNYREGDVTNLPYAESSFQVVLCHHVVEHVKRDVQVLRECYRVLAPGGLFILGIPQEGGALGKILRTIHFRLYAEGEHINFYTIARMHRLISDQGFVGIRYNKFGFLFPFYYLHLLLLSNSLTFRIGHAISQYVDAVADSLIFVSKK